MAKIYGELESAQLERRNSDPPNAKEGMIYFNTVSSHIRLYKSSSWVTIADLSSTQTLTNKDIDGGTASNTSRITIPKAAYATLTGLSRKQGTLVYATDLQKVYYDDGTSLNEVGSGSTGSKNYISNFSAEIGTTGWSTYDDGATNDPVDGTGGTAQSDLWNTSSTTPLRGELEFLLDKTGATSRRGQGVSFDFTIDNADKAKVLSITFDYAIRTASNPYADGDVTVWVYDKDAGQLIQPAGYKILNAAQNLSQKHIATFQTSASSTNYRLIFHISSTSANDYAIGFDSISVGPQAVVYGAPITDWQDYTPTITTDTGSMINYTARGRSRRVGDSLEFTGEIEFTGSSGTWHNITASIPTGLSIDTSKLTSSTQEQAIGVCSALNNAITDYAIGKLRYNTTTTVKPWYAATNTADAGSTVDPLFGVPFSNTYPFTFDSGDKIFWSGRVPISGWSSSVQMSNDTDTRVVAGSFESNSFTSVSSGVNTTITLGVTTLDTHQAWNGTNTYTIPVSGVYSIGGMVSFAANATGNRGVLVQIDGVDFVLGLVPTITTGVRTRVTGAPRVFRLNAGTTVRLKGYQDGAPTLNAENFDSYLSIERLSGPATIAASETCAARYYNSSGQSGLSSGGAGTVITGWTKSFDTHGIFNASTGVATIPISGKWLVQGQYLLYSATNFLNAKAQIEVQQSGSGSELLIIGSVHAQSADHYAVGGQGSNIIQCLAGDTLTVRLWQSLGTTRTLYNDGDFNWISFTRIGN